MRAPVTFSDPMHSALPNTTCDFSVAKCAFMPPFFLAWDWIGQHIEHVHALQLTHALCAGIARGVPEGYSIVSVSSDSTVSSEGSMQREWTVQSSASQIRVWEHSVHPATTSSRLRAFEWLEVAPVLHNDVSTEDVAAMQRELEQQARLRPQTQA
jgi:hypothetical protein